MTVEEFAKLLEKLIAEGKGDYIISLDGYEDVDVDVEDYCKRVRLW